MTSLSMWTRTGTLSKLVHANDVAELQYEHDVMLELYHESSGEIVRTYRMLHGSSREIVSAQGENCDGFVGFAMQREEDENLAEFLKNPKRRNMDIFFKLPFAKRLVDILIAVHSSDYVLMDFKPMNVVRVHENDDYVLKAIDFGSAKVFGAEITKDNAAGTPLYISPEVVRLMRSSSSSSCEVVSAKPAIDVFSLGLSVFEIATGISFWEYLDVRFHPTVDVPGVLKTAISLTDPSTTAVLETSLPGEIYRDLRSWFLDALRARPVDRWTAKRLLTDQSLFR